MKTITMRKSVLLVLGVLILGAGGVFSMQNIREESGHKVASQQDAQDMRMNPSMMESMAVANDKEFIEGMIPHHQEAIDTAKEVLERGGDIASIKVLARNIITAQEREIALMKEWYMEWFGTEYSDTGTYMNMMRPLSPYSGRELDIVFTKDMIVHHMGAVMMARQALNFSERDEMITLSGNIIESQIAEIQLMQAVLRGATEEVVEAKNNNREMLPSLVTVTQGDVVTMRVRSDEVGEFHISGYEIENDITTSELLEFSFLANKPGRYNFELHPETENEDVVIGTLVVNPS